MERDLKVLMRLQRKAVKMGVIEDWEFETVQQMRERSFECFVDDKYATLVRAFHDRGFEIPNV